MRVTATRSRKVLVVIVSAALGAALLRFLGVEVTSIALVAATGVAAAAGAARLRQLPRSLTMGAPTAPRDVVGVIGGLFAVFAGWVVLNSLATPSVRSAVNGPDATSGYSPLLVLVLMAGLPLAGAAFFTGRRTCVRARALPVVFTVLLLVKLVIGALLLKVPPFDAGSVFLAAYGAAVPHAADYPFDRDFADYYFGIYPNNLTLASFFSTIFRVVALTGVTGFGAYAAVAVGVNAVVLTATELLTFVVVRRTWGVRAASAALVALALWTTLSPWINTPYSDTLGSVFPIGILAIWGLLRRARSRRSLIGLAVLLGAVVSIGVSVKPTVLFALLAVVGVDLVRHRRILTRRSVAAAAAAVVSVGVITAALVSLGLTALAAGSGVVRFDVWTNPNGFPIAHFLKMGSTGNGGFNGDDYVSTQRTPPDQRTAESIEVYAQRVRAMGLEGYGLFLGEKSLRTFGDGTFAQGVEGDPFPASVLNQRWAEQFRLWYTRGGTHHISLASLWQASWLLLLLACAVPAGRYARGEQRRRLDSARIALLMLLAFLLLFEARSRYVYLDLPLVIVAAVGTLHGVPALLADLRTLPLRRALGIGGRQGRASRRAGRECGSPPRSGDTVAQSFERAQ